MKKVKLICLAVAFLIGLSSAYVIAGWDANAENKATEAIKAFKKKDSSMKAFFDKAAGYAVFPTVGKGGFGIGGAHGKGTVFQAKKAVGSTSLSQLTIGFQFGGQSYSQIIFFQNKKMLETFQTGKFEFSAQASAVAADTGVAATVGYNGGVAIFTMTKAGLMYEASIGGQKFSYKAKE
ncbi:MAG: YSC84-related protein [Thiohalomonadales bacterium]